VGEFITVFVAPTEFPSLLVVHNGLQGSQPISGTWTFPQVQGADSTIAGRVVNAALAQPHPIGGALVQAVHCSPVACSRTTTPAGFYRLVNLVAGPYTLSVTAPAFCGGPPRSVIVRAGQTTIVNVALLPCLPAGAHPSPITACGAITKPGAYVVTRNLGPVYGDCLDISAPAISLNLADHTLSGNGSGRGAGIHLFPRAPGARIWGGAVRHFGVGIMNAAADAQLTSLFPQDHQVGILVVKARGSRVRDSFPMANSQAGIVLRATRQSQVVATTEVGRGAAMGSGW
jgi:hypothetical protein